jgi:uncharacterized protein YceK
MRHVTATRFALPFVAAAAGCGTINNVAFPGPQPANGSVIASPQEVYGGVRSSFREGFESGRRVVTADFNDLRSPLESGLAASIVEAPYMLVVDTPLSAIGDTLTLPITVPAAIDRAVAAYYFPEQHAAEQAARNHNGEKRKVEPAARRR